MFTESMFVGTQRTERGAMTRYIFIVAILGIVMNGCAPIDSEFAEQMKRYQVEARYILEYETPLYSPYVESYPADIIIPDDRPSFLIDPTAAWAMSFGRGEYNMVRMDGQGIVQLLYYDYAHAPEGGWRLVGKKSLLTLSVEDISEFIKYINASPLLEMPTAYHAAFREGTTWGIKIQQGMHRKSLTFHNHFPETIIEFANAFDRFLVMHGLLEVPWETIPEEEADHYSRTLWAW
jgi:hypothetical protein